MILETITVRAEIALVDTRSKTARIKTLTRVSRKPMERIAMNPNIWKSFVCTILICASLLP